MESVLVIHGGGPTPVINSSLYGVLREARRMGIQRVWAAPFGARALLEERFIDLLAHSEEEAEGLLTTPASAIGTSRFPLEPEDYPKMAEILKKHGLTCVLLNGGNGTMDTCGKLAQACQAYGIRVVGIPKTIDNDIAITDHTPGYGSAARYLAATVREIAQDVRSMPIHVCIIEALGRNAGWIAAASALARAEEGSAPHLIYLPERPFQEQEFLEDVKKLHAIHGGVVVVASEGLTGADGQPIVPPIFTSGRAAYYGDVGAHLAGLVIRKLGIKARSEKPGLAGRASIAWQSVADREEAICAGEAALRAAVDGQSSVMVGLRRVPGSRYEAETFLVPIKDVMLVEKTFPEEWITPRGNDVAQGFVTWATPLIGGPLPEFTNWTGEAGKESL